MNANRMLVHEGLGVVSATGGFGLGRFGRILGVGHYGHKYVGRFGPLPQMIIGSPVYS